ncbi:MAG TPA: hypothetical protein VJQ43_01465 [Thermoplasmata archaeon]|nr:hypothetical protein [Thermoplasmata archaeon]
MRSALVFPVMRRWVTIHQRRRRARRGQVSAVATILALLLLVAFIANFIIGELPAQMIQNETSHILTVEDQLARLQATIAAEATVPHTHIALASPLTLGSAADPPFGQAATSSVQTEVQGVGTVATYQVSNFESTPISWGSGSACLPGGKGTCATAGAKDTYNFAGNNTALPVKISGSGDSLFYNLTGSNDTLTITWTGPNANVAYVVVNGTNDSVTLKKSATDVASPKFFFSFYGATDTFTLTPSGSKSGPGGTLVSVLFVGSLGGICPWGNLSATDQLGTLGNGGKFVNITTTWSNALGYSSPPSAQAYGSGVATFLNSTGPVACAFAKPFSTGFTAQEAGGILVHIYNHYVAQTLVAFDQGAVVAQESGGGSIMVDPPLVSVTNRPAGTVGAITLLNLVMTPSTQAGISTAALMSRVLSVTTVTVLAGSEQALTSPLTLTITTLFPDAWWSYIQTLPTAFPSGATCVTIHPVTAPSSCLSPPSGTTEEVIAPMVVQSLTITEITAQVWLD